MRRGKVIDNIPKKIVLRTVLTVFVITFVALAINIQPAEAQPRTIIKTYGEGYLEYVNGVLVLHVKGSAYEMGYQNGFLLKDTAQTRIQNRIQGMIDKGYSYEYLVNCSQAMEPHIPQEYIQEMEGLADGASMNYTDVLIGHTYIDTQYYGLGWTGCSGFAVFGNATIDGHLYHGRAFDLFLNLGESLSLITAYEPENGNAYVNIGWPGIIGVSTGMNKEGITVELNLSISTNRTLDGMPIHFILKKALQYSNNLTDAIDVICQADRTTGYNVLLGDGKNLNAASIEVSDNYCKVFWAGDLAEDIEPHYSIPNVVRRTNHYVDPELAATQRSPYDPRVTWCAGSWDRYEKVSQLIEDNYSNITAEMSIEFLRTPPVAWAEINLTSMVFDSTDLELWFADSVYGIPAYEREFIHLPYDDLFLPPMYPTVTTKAATEVRMYGASLNTDYTVGDFSPVQVRFAYKRYADTGWSYTDWVSKESDGTHDTFITSLAPSTQYEFKTQLKYDDTVIEGDTLQFVTDTLSPPSPRAGCFIATAAYDTPIAEEIQTLREFRDEYLLTNPVGQAFVDFYYNISPPIAEFITDHPSLKPIVRVGLVPAVAISTVVINTTTVEKVAIVGLLVLVPMATTIWVIRRQRRDSEYT